VIEKTVRPHKSIDVLANWGTFAPTPRNVPQSRALPAQAVLNHARQPAIDFAKTVPIT
jgi:hypothetical protein